MRAYSVNLTNPVTGNPVKRSNGTPVIYSSWIDNVQNGKIDRAALNIEIDSLITGQADPSADAATMVTIHGVSLIDIASANNFVGQNISIYGGMAKGLPLANPAQYGLLVQGFVYQAFGNWVGTSMCLVFWIKPGSGIGNNNEPASGGMGSENAPVNLAVTWKAGTTMASFIAATLAQAFPASRGYSIPSFTLDSRLTTNHDIPMVYQSLGQFAQYILDTSQAIINGDPPATGSSYTGVQISLRGLTIKVYDGTSKDKPKDISFLDFVGQPTWIAFPAVKAFLVMRGDLSVGDFIKLPPGLYTNTAAALSSFKNKAAFTGVFQIYQIRHVGNFRQATGTSWCTAIEAYPETV